MDQAALKELIAAEAPGIASALLEVRARAHNEQELRSGTTPIIKRFLDGAAIQITPREEYTLFDGRADAVYDRLVLEYEDPGCLGDRNTLQINRHAVQQAKDYMAGLAVRERRQAERLAGVVFDGARFIFVRYKNGAYHVDDPVRVAPSSTERFLRLLASLSTERALIAENLVEEFGEGTPIARAVVSALYDALATTDSKRTRKLFEQWSTQFTEVCDYATASQARVDSEAAAFGVEQRRVDPFALFFCIHTYYALVIKALAVQVARFYLMPRLGTDLRRAAGLSPAELRRYLQRMEDGDVFADMRIRNFLEADFFSWYLDNWSDRMDAAVRRVVSELGYYSLVTLDVDPDATRDLLKNLYQDLMPKHLRHSLGEYYTPDWLAERLLNQLDGGRFRGDPDRRLLDPACGSGTFLVLAIRAMREYGARAEMSECDVLEKILENVVGFDLNPLAVISARTNYLLALGDLLQHRRKDVAIPVYLCDSVLTPARSNDMFDGDLLTLRTTVGTFAVPSCVVEAHSIDAVAQLLEESVRFHRSDEEFADEARSLLGEAAQGDERAVNILVELYGTLCRLEEDGVNGLWARIIKNAFAPLFVGRFDLVAANPPWVNWEHLPDAYRDSTKPLWAHYGLFTLEGHEARLGGGKKDISMLMLYVAADKYLEDGGTLGFVITQTVFKTKGAGEGFRRFRIGDGGAPLRVTWVDDMSAIKPFEGASNRTAVMLVKKGQPTKYPVQVRYWRKRRRGGRLPESAELSQVITEFCRTSNWVAEPVDDENATSPWLTGRRQGVRAARRLVGPSAFRAREGCNTGGLNGAYWVRVVTEDVADRAMIANLGDVGRQSVDSIQCAVEKKSVYPLLRGQDVSRWRAEPSLHIVLAQDESAPSSKAIAEKELKRQRPATWRYFRRFEESLRGRSGYRAYLEHQPFYAVYNCGSYVFAPWKVVWREQAAVLTSAVVGPLEGRAVVPDHKLMLVACEGPDEAHFLCGLLSTCIAAFVVASYALETATDTHVLENVPVPKYEPRSTLHRRIVKACSSGHRAAAQGDGDAVEEFVAALDAMAAGLWGVSDAELKDIRQSLADLSS